MPKKNINKELDWLTNEGAKLQAIKASYADNDISLSELEKEVAEELRNEDIKQERKIHRVLTANFTSK